MRFWFSKTCVKQPLSKRPKIVFNINYRLIQDKSILQYFRLSLSYRLFIRALFCLFLSDHFTQVLLYLLCRPVTDLQTSLCSVAWSTNAQIIWNTTKIIPQSETSSPSGHLGMHFLKTHIMHVRIQKDLSEGVQLWQVFFVCFFSWWVEEMIQLPLKVCHHRPTSETPF